MQQVNFPTAITMRISYISNIIVFPVTSYCDQHQVKRTGVCTGTPPPVSSTVTSSVTVSPPIYTASPTVPTMTAKCVQNGPTAWMSVSVPTPYNQGDVDSIRNLRSQYTFCNASQMTAIECRVVGTTTSSAAAGQRVFCDLRNGLKCYHSDQNPGEQCHNYEVRVTCDCSLPHTTTIAPNTLPTGSPTPRRMDLGTSTTTLHPNQTFVTPPKPPSTSTECKEPGWTNWMNSVKPVDGNDIEFLPGLVKSFGFCREDQIAYTQCRRVSDKLSFDDTEDLQTVCSTKAGFACYGSNQPDGRCDDYEFRVYCQCENSVCDKQLISDVRSVGDTQFTASTSVSSSTAAMARLDSVSGWRAASVDRTPWVQVNFQEPVTVAGVITQAVKDGSAYTSKYTLSYGSFNCSNFQTYNGTDGKTMVFEGNTGGSGDVQHILLEEIKAVCVRLSPIEFTGAPALRFDILGCRKHIPLTLFTTTTLMPTTSGHVTGVTTVSSNITTPMPFICVPGWTPFISVDTPGALNTWEKSGPGDTEPITELRNLYGFCAYPTGIQCRTKVDKLPYTMSLDFDTVCNLEKGFECLNSAQGGMECGDYEVSFQCDCGTTSQIATTISNVTGTPSAPKPACGWTNFINSYPRTPTSTGDYETIHNVRMKYVFCEFPVRIECRDTETKKDYRTISQAGVSCDVNRGLVCEDNGQSGEKCKDYEVRLYCVDACSSTISPGHATGTPTLTPPGQSSSTPTLTSTGQGTGTPTLTPTDKANGTPSMTTAEATATPTLKPPGQDTDMPTYTPPGQSSGTPTLTPPGMTTGTPTLTPTDKVNVTATMTPTGQPTGTPTLTTTGKATNTTVLTPPGQRTGTPTLTPTGKINGTPTMTPTGQHTGTPTLTTTGTVNGTPTMTTTGKATDTTTLTPPGQRTGTPTLTPTGKTNGTPTLTPTGKATDTTSLTPTAGQHTGTPTLTTTGTVNGTPSMTPPDQGTDTTTLTPPGMSSGTPTLTPQRKATDASTLTPTAKANGTTTMTPPGTDTDTPTLTPPSKATDTPTLKPTPGKATGTPTLMPTSNAIGTPILTPPGQTTGTQTLTTTGKVNGTPTMTPPDQGTDTTTLTPPGMSSGTPTLTPPRKATGTPTLTSTGKASGTPTMTPPGTDTDTPTITQPRQGTDIPTLPPPTGQAPGSSTLIPPGKITNTPTLAPPGQDTGTPTLISQGIATGKPTMTPPDKANGTPTLIPQSKATGTPTLTPPGTQTLSSTGQVRGSTGTPTLTPTSQVTRIPTLTPPEHDTGTPTLSTPTITPSLSGPPGTGTPTFTPPSILCKEGWTDWINLVNPAKSEGDFETYKSIQGYPNTCEEVVAAECQIASTGQNYMYSGQAVSCSPEGLMCEDGPSQKCVDYKIKFFCSCPLERTTPRVTTIVKPPPGVGSGTPTMTPPGVSSGTPTMTPPGVGSGTPTLTPPGVGSGSPTMTPRSQKTGVPTITPPSVTGVPGTTGHYNCTQGWTSAMSVTTSAITGDELETISDLRRKYEFCDDEMIVSIRCADLISEKTAEELGQKVTCDMTQGLICKGADQAGGKCADYTVQLYCDCEAPLMTTTLAPPIIPGGTPALRPPYHEQVTPTLKPTSHTGESPVTPRKSCDMPLGVTDRQIVSDSQLSASTSFNFSYEATNGRLMQQPSGTNGGAWMPRFFDTQQFIQVDFGHPEKISGVLTQGRQDTDQWVESFLIETSLDGIHWYKYADRDSKKAYTIFPANFDRNTAVKSFFDREVDAQYVRIVPMTWKDKIALRFDVLSCYGRSKTQPPGRYTTERPTITTPTSIEPTPSPLCLEPMGIDNPMLVKDGQLTSSSNLDSMHGAAAGRLYNEFTGWAPVSTSGKQWLQVDLLEPRYVSGILTQGIPDKDMWSVQYVVSFSNDGNTFTAYSEKNGGLPMVFNANNDRNSIVKMMFNRNIVGRYVRVTPIEGGWAGIGLRFNLIGCFNISTTAPPMTSQTVVPPTPSFVLPNMTTPIIIPPTQIPLVCTIPMGIGNRYTIGANQISASSSLDIEPISSWSSGIKLPWTPTHPPSMPYIINNILNIASSLKSNLFCRPTDPHPYVQVDFLEPKALSGVLIQGSPYKSEWVTSYQVYTSLDGNTWTPYSDILNAKIPTTFKGNKDNTGQVTNLFNRNIYGRFIRLYAISFHTAATLIFEVFGCNPSEAVNMTTTESPSGVSTLTPTVSPPAVSKNTPTITPPSRTGTQTTQGFGKTVSFTTQTYVAPPTVCLTPMGLEYTRTVFDRQITSSSKINEHTGASQGRIHSNSSWIPSINDSSPWIQVNFENTKLLSGILTQGENGGQRWVTKYTVDFSMDGKTFYPYTLLLGDSKPVVFSGNNDSNSLVRQLFNRNVTAQYIRIHPQEWHGNSAAIRFNIIGCNPDSPQTPTVTTPSPSVTPPTNGTGVGTTTVYEHIICTVPMGVANTLIVKDQQLSASSSKDMFSGAERSRFDAQKDGSFYGGWVAGESNKKQFIQVDFLAPYYVGGIKTEGRSDKDQWVTKYEIYYSTDGKHYSALPKSYLDSSPMVFSGNKDSGTPVTNLIHPVEWHNAIAVRFEVLGCMSPSRSHLSTTALPTTPTSQMSVTGSRPLGTGSTTGTTPASSVSPTACAYWTPWVSASKPDKEGEYESAWQLKQLITFCDYQYVQQTECRTTGTHIPFDQTGENGVICNNDLQGLLCYAKNQTDGSCLDYEIRVFCDECASTPAVTTAAPKTCNPRWLPWINNMTPTTDMSYVEHEFMSLQKQQELCFDGKITRIECQTIYGVSFHSAGTVGSTCEILSGLTCKNSDNYPVPCDDYQVRYYCDCAPAPTLHPTGFATGTPTITPPGYTGTGIPTQTTGGNNNGTPTLTPPGYTGTGTHTITPPGYTGTGTPTITPPGYTGTGTPTVTPPGYTGTGTPTITPPGYTGTGTPTITPPGYTGTGTPTITPPGYTGTGTPTISPPGYTGTGTPTITHPDYIGTGTPTITPPGYTGTGTTTMTPPGYTGTGTPTITPPGYTGTGTPTITPPGYTGTGTPTITPPSYTGTGTPTITPPGYNGTGTPTITPPGYTATGTPTITSPGYNGTGTPTITPPGYTGTGTPTITPPGYTGTGTPTITPQGYTGTGTPTITPPGYTGTGTPTITPPGYTGTGTPTITPPGYTGTGTPTITPPGYTGTGTPTITPPGYTGTGTPTITPPGYTGTGTSTITPPGYTGTGTPTITPPGYTGTGTPTITPPGYNGTGLPTITPPGYTGTGAPTQKPGGNDNGTPTLTPPGYTGTDIPTITPPGYTGTGTPTITPPGYTGTGTPTITLPGYTGTGTPTITPPGYTGTGTPTITPPGYTGTGSPTITPPGYTGTGTPTITPPGYTGTGTPTQKPGGNNNGTPTLTPPGYTGTGTPTITPPGFTGTGSPTGYSGTGVPTVSPTGHSGGTPTLTPTTCAIVSKWSSWVNRHTPDATTDEIESMTAAEKLTFCGLGKIIAVECKTIHNIPSYSTGDFGIKCDITNGATCEALDNFPIGCQDYMIRYQCQEQICGEPTTTSQTTDGTGTGTFSPKVPGQNTPTVTPPGGSTATPTAVPTTVCATTTRWSSWMNRDKPTTGEGDKEVMTGEEKQKFCPSGAIATVECASIDGVPSYQSMDIVDCNPITGVFCDNSVNMGMCSDYMIRYQCEETTCTGPTLPPTTQSQSTLTTPQFSRTTTSPGQGGKLTTYTHKGTTHTGTVSTFKPPKFASSTAHPNTSGNKTPTQSPSLICETKKRWSMWIDRRTPGINATGDHEYMTTTELQRFCARGTISGVECQTFDGTNFDKTPDFVTCTMENGLICDGAENFPITCMDYKMRYECIEEICQTPTGLPTSAAGTPTAHLSSVTGGVPTVRPSGSYTGTTTLQPPGLTGEPTANPQIATGGVPTETPKRSNTEIPTMHPTGVSGEPTALPPNSSGGVPTLTPKESNTGTPTMHPTGVSGEPTDHPPNSSGGVPTLNPKESNTGTPTMHPTGVSGEPTALLPNSSGGVPTLTPKESNTGTPTMHPTGISGETTALPPNSSGGVPTLTPKESNTGTPTMHPTGISGEPTALPPNSSGGVPTLTPKESNTGTPTMHPMGVSGEPTDHPPNSSGGVPTLTPKESNTGTPTMHPTGVSGEPTALPPNSSGGVPTLTPKESNTGTPTMHPTGISGEPTALPPKSSGGVPTLTPKESNTGTSTMHPTGVSGEPTAHLSTGRTGIPSVNRCTQSHWSSWINRDNPNIGVGDYESMTDKEKADFCIGGNIKSIECVTTDGVASYSSGEIMSCTLLNGFSCNNQHNAPVPCSDYKIRYFCLCEETSSTTSVKPTSTIPFNGTLPPTLHLTCGWSPWLNGDRPNFGSADAGDLETIGSLKTKFGLCKNIVDISCRVAGTDTLADAAGQTEVLCDSVNGLRCYNRDQQGGMCYDYEVSVLCWAAECSQQVTPTLVTGANRTTVVCPPGEVWESCAQNCSDLCESYAQSTGLCNSENPCVPMCRNPIVKHKCALGELLKDKNTCVAKQMCPCIKPDGSVAQAYETWPSPTDNCSLCQCSNNEINCKTYENCYAIPQATTTTLIPPMLNGSIPTIRPIITYPDCGWTAWINSDRPSYGNGDFEIISNIRRLHHFCVSPLLIECRDIRTHTAVKDGSQKVSCDVTTGLKCLNTDNAGGCNDYEIRFFCPCVCKFPTTVSPNPGSNRTPTQHPISASTGFPSEKPNRNFNKTTTKQPMSVSGGTPTLKPTMNNTTTNSHSTKQPVHSGVTPTMSPTAPGVGVSTAGPVLCGWTTWMDGHKPDASTGESETFSELRTIYQFCKDIDIQGIECRVKDTHAMINQTDQVNVMCTIASGGLMCFGFEQPTGRCLDYEIRIFCEPAGQVCSGTSTGKPSAGSSSLTPTLPPPEHTNGSPTNKPPGMSAKLPTAFPTGMSTKLPTAHPPSKCVDKWSPWINRDTQPDGKEHEHMNATEKATFCVDGRVSGIECMTIDNIASYSSGEILECSMENGLICEDAVNAPIPCSDYKVRYHCECPVVCREKMGMENGHIVTNMISVSSSRDGNLNPASARLNSHGAWTPNHNDQKQYIQVNFLKPMLLTGIITQGRENSGSYVTSYKVLFSNDGFIWSPYQDFGQDKIFSGNNNSGSMATNWFEHPIRGQYIRVVPLTWKGVIAMRMELLGCYEGYPSVTTVPQPTFTQSVVTPNTPPTVSNSCIFWDVWVNEGHLTLTSGGDSEPISALQSLSERCTTPIMIDCVRASDELPYDQAGQKVKCDLWNGLQCFNADNSPLCYDYKARLGCLKNTTECLNSVSTTQPGTTSTVNKRVLLCFEGLDISACPKDGCADGLYCDGRQCVTKDKCPCLVDGQILMSGGFKERSNCETCQCIAGEVNCEPKKCSPCLQGFSLVINKTTCECSCRSCPPGEFRCGNGECIPQERRCDGIIDCIDDEVGCVSTPMFTPPVYATATPTLPPKSIGTGQPTAIPPGGSTGNPLLVNGTSPTATFAPVQCNSQWTSWINTDTPDTGDGDRESWTAAQKAAFCPNGKVSRIECMTSDGIASYSSGEIMQCTVEGGAVCLTADNAPMPCSDFKIRYFCDCNGTEVRPNPCKNKYLLQALSWTAAGKAAFCPYGKISRIECRTIDDIASYSSGEIMQCTIEEGAVCLNNDNFPIPCSDYKIKYFCECAVSPTLHPTGASGGIPTVTPPGVISQTPNLVSGSTTSLPGQVTTGVPVQCSSNWSSWINTDTPDSGDGDRESWTAAQKAAFCPYGKISRIECRTIDDIASYSSGEIMQCTIEEGAVCLNNDNFPVPCSDYKIKYFCECAVSPTLHPTGTSGGIPTVTPPGVKTQTPNLVPGSTTSLQGQVTTGASVQCSSNWSSWINTDTPDSGDGDRESWTAAQTAAFCPYGKISRIECRTIDDIASYSSGEIMQCTIEGGAVCLNNNNFPVPCSDYKIRYYCECTDSGASTSTSHGQVTTGAPVQCTSTWSSWINTDTPYSNDGDRETWSAAQKAAFCPHGNITRIECRTTDDIVSYSSGEIMQCSIEGGAVCLNDDNFPVPCSDYKIKYFCECTAEPTLPPPIGQSPRTTTMGRPPTIRTTHTHGGPSIVPCLTRWSRWINRDQPDSGRGDIEKMNAHELNVFCPEGRIKGIECFTVNGTASYKSEEMLSCSINNGFECLNDNNFPIPCSDYKIRYYCDCEVSPFISTPHGPVMQNRNTPVPAIKPPCIPEKCLPMVKPVLKEGEELQTVIDANGCCFKHIVVCKPNLCAPPILNCPAPMSLEPAVGESDCCLTYRCMCPTICPTTTKPVCKPDQDAVEIQTRCNCTLFACMTKILVFPPPGQNTCQYKLADNTTQTYQTGQSWSDGVCTHCACLDKGGVADTGYKTIARLDQCCGDCQPNGCINNGTIYKDGATMETSKKCYDQLCIFDAELDMFLVSETHVQCPAYEQLADCKANEETYDATGCCMKCLPERNVTSHSCQTCAPRLVVGNPNDTIGYFTIMDNMEVCKNVEPIPDLLECSGFCNSRSSYSHVMQGFTDSCNCCQATGSETRNVQLTCKNGRKITKSYSVPKSCGCSACSGAK
ncbi:MFGM-like protein [Mya arenaria]|uniref:MFGM-like protein n=1 Tax=Mya arenaria TaxID=6604 RepID=A0ABY7EIW0_MYAAR|nr:MFGM-like protein [Mya arenaria]